jgi:uncharacterized metal-binding protein
VTYEATKHRPPPHYEANDVPPGRTHDLINVTTFAVTAVAITVIHSVSGEQFFSREEIVGYAAGYLIGTLWLSPDLDLNGTLPQKRWGPLKILWYPYARAFKHRGVSHGFVFGPLTRLLYLALLVTPAAFIPGVWTGAVTFVLSSPTAWWLWGLVGYYVSCWVHLVADKAPFRL